MEQTEEYLSPAEFEQRALSMPEQAQALVIVDGATYQQAGEFLVAVKDLRRQIAEHHQPMIAAALEAHRAAIAARKKLDEPLEQAERIVKGAIGKWTAQEERKRREAEAALRAEAKRIEEEARINEALQLEAAGQKDEAQRVIEAPAFVPAISIESTAPKVQGISTRKKFGFRIKDEQALPRAYLIPDEKKIRRVVEAMGREANIPGIEVTEETIVAAGRR